MNKYIVVLLFSLVGFSSCNKDYLDITPSDRVVSDQVWNDANLVKLYVNGLYAGIPHGFDTHLWSKYTDEAYGDNTWLMGTWTADNITSFGASSNYIDYFKRAYQYIRSCNIYFNEIDNSPVSDNDKAALSAQVHFIRAFIYANLLWRYGGMPIVEEIYDLGDEVKFGRNSYQEVLDYIIQEIDAAIPHLPEKYGYTESNFGRATQHAAIALKSRVYLYAASPLNNPDNDKSLWQKAADAAKLIIDENAYDLVPNYENIFLDVNQEILFARTFNNTNGHLVSFINTNHTYGGWGGWGGRNVPSQNLVEDYEMINGEMIFNADGTINPASGYDPQNPYVNRDPRFYQTVIYNGDTFRPELRGSASPDYDVTMHISGLDASENPILTGTYGIDSYKVNGDNSRTSYNWKKFIDRNLVISRSNGGYSQPWIFFRLGEIYLNYAEAMFELGFEDTARDYVNLIRERAGMPSLPSTITGDELKMRIRHERRIELVLEAHRFFDVRRWMIAPEVESDNIRGVEIYKYPNGELLFREVTLIERPQWDDKFYWIPIPRSEINKDSGLTQNPGWD
ncbi:RagB/SusD family nutrient uptake outer membrane protein [Gaoshiqia sediminis]|uniref:RagB/SusD family nutrient uptake outer membrane protein n=1 Tax=Gaoshiqia sediminis TaxID=2986998 RepID=A0AA41Y3T9_9BACT|nr:RagB/SusD family nutrient uptake outer membrane protein [Gaoshiqia sediminis]MCW0481320.1 RagB/SusD family nutrient uptake outer membrane protein [Gaoshiqia sediminis]